LQKFLKRGLAVGFGHALASFFQRLLEKRMAQNFSRGSQAGIQINGSEDGFESVRQQSLLFAPAGFFFSAAEAQVRIGEAATGIGREMDNTGLAIQRAKDKTDQMQARASAIDELVSSGDLEELGSTKTPLDRELSQLASQQQVDRELEQMKAEVGSGGEKKELESS